MAGSAASPNDVDALVRSLFEIYTSTEPARQRELVKQVYAEEAVFRDNVAYARGIKELQIMWQGLPKLFPKVQVEVLGKELEPVSTADAATLGDAAPTGGCGASTCVSGTTHKLLVKNTQTYDIGGGLAWLTGKQVTLPVTTTLQLGADGKVLEHQDEWEGKGTAPLFMRKLNGGFTNLMLKVTGTRADKE